jgi:hypothetical protein
MLGTRRFLATHPDPSRLVAGLSLDNVGKWFYQGVDLDPRGQFRGYGALWFQLLVRDVAVAVGETPAPRVYGLLDQVLGQAVPISFMDEGPLVAAGIPAVGLAGTVPAEFAALHYATYHDPGDTLELQAAGPLGPHRPGGRGRGAAAAGDAELPARVRAVPVLRGQRAGVPRLAAGAGDLGLRGAVRGSPARG